MRLGHAEPLSSARQRDDLGLWWPGIDYWSYLLDVDAILKATLALLKYRAQ
jgi:hypothetical protein